MASHNDQLPADVLDALQRGQTIEAIKLLREATGLGLREAKDAIDAHLDGDPVSLPLPSNVVALRPDVVAALRRGDKIEAIRLLRLHSGLGLKEAKDAIDASPQADQASLAPGEVIQSGIGKWVLAMLVVVAVAWYIFH